MAWMRWAALAAALAIAGEARAGGWQEVHETTDDVRVEVGPDGVGIVQHHLRYRIVAGHFKTFDIVGVDPRAELVPEAVLTAEKGGGEIVARVEPVPKTPGTIRILIDEDKGLGRGAYIVDVKYKLDLLATKMLTRDGAMWKLAWTSPPAPEGHDGARVIFDLPSALTEPRIAAAADTTTTLSTLRRGKDRDELELVRVHIPRGEAAAWAVRVDPKAFPKVNAPDLRPPPPPDAAPPSIIASNVSRVLVACGFALLAGILAMLLREKQRAVSAVAELCGAEARPLVSMRGAGPFAYGVITSASLAVLLWSNPSIGAGLVLLAMALAAHRAPVVIARPRGPGAWERVSDRTLLPEARRPLPTDALDVGSRRGRATLAALAVAVGATAWLLRLHIPQIAVAVPLSAAALLPIFVTGTRAQLPKRTVETAARLLRPARDALATAVDLAHVDATTMGRAVGTTGNVDELRLVCVPRDRMPGLRAIELAVAVSSAGGVSPEVLVRFEDATSAAARIAQLADGAATLRGRATEERVVRLVPEEGTAEAAAALVGRLLLSLEGRRASDRARAPRRGRWKGPERRAFGVSARGEKALAPAA